MKKAGRLLFWASVVLIGVGTIDRLTPNPLIAGLAAGTFWKGGMALVAWSIALALQNEPRRIA